MPAAGGHARGGSGALALRLFLLLALVYLLSGSGNVLTPDGVVMGRTAESLLERGELAVDGRGFPPGFLLAGPDGRLYGKYPPGLPLAATPFYALGRGLAGWLPPGAAEALRGPRVVWYRLGDPGEAFRFLGLSLTNAFVVAATLALVLLLMVEVGYAARTAVLACATLGLASPLWPYARDFFAEPLGGLGLVAFALAAERSRRGRAGAALAAGLALGASVLAKVAHLALLPGAAVVMLALPPRAGTGPRGRLARGAAFAAGVASMLAVLGAFNLARFGSLAATGYEPELGRWTTPAATGILGLVASPGRGLLTHFPLALLAVVLTPAAFRRSPHWTLFTWGSLAILVLVYCRWHAWEGGWCWGPRFLVPILPFLALLVAPALEGPRAPLVARAAFALLGALSLFVAFTGTLVPYTDFHQAARERIGAGYLERVCWEVSLYPPLAYWHHQPGSSWLLWRALRGGAASPGPGGGGW